MCGIIAVLNKDNGANDITNVIIEALERLEYRGYDSSGIAYLDSINKTHRIRSVGRIEKLSNEVKSYALDKKAIVGIGHTRWATHGVVSVKNAHPHKTDGISIAHNGIIENYKELSSQFNINLESDTDSEVISQLIAKFMEDDLNFEESFKKTVSLLRGTYGIVAICEEEPNILIGAKKGSPLAIGYSVDQIYIASDAIALSSLSENVIYLQEGDIVVCKNNKYTIYDKDFKEVAREITNNIVSMKDITKCGLEDYMLKEIHEEPNVLLKTFENFENPVDIKKYKSLYLIACGTSHYAGLLAKYWIEDISGILVNVEIASEFRYRNPVLDKDSLYIFISQSGETIDTLCAMRNVIDRGFDTLSIVNVENSSIIRESKYKIRTHAGMEIGVASTKAFISQALTLLLLILEKNKIPTHKIAESMQSVIDMSDFFEDMAQKIRNSRTIIYMGRGTSYPISLEGALKMKEITYVSSEGCPAGEIKHGPIALIDTDVYAVILAPHDRYYEKTISNAQEIIARNGRILTIGSGRIQNHDSIEINNTGDIGNPFVLTTAVHMLAYYTAKSKGLDVDKPRNLAKSVTVE
ncbi:MAG: glutamine--fructose-6-phosphate transaminase (isomerizing) [Holosporales bacterium]|jgi:glucosamine--fructose-6-phosphate aminotransferase (isomerizing)|nr:glutamine--fructose-6-phosphate transaminase (isomerizing) [Holosporales bacterium]